MPEPGQIPKEILKEPQEIYLAQLLSEAHTIRNQTAMTYTRGKTKAKKKSYITGMHGSGSAKMKAEIRRKRANRNKKK